MKTVFTLFVGIFLAVITLEAQVTITSTDTFITSEQMLLANEINESGEPFAEALGYDLDELDPMVLNDPDSISYTLGIENYEYSRYQLGTVISRSGIGLHMMWGPMIMQMAAMEPPGFDGSMTGTPNGFNEDDELMKNIMHFAMLSNGMAPMNPWPQFAEFQSGDPHLPQAVADDFRSNFESLRWDRSKMDKTFNPGAMGQTLMKQYLWAQDMLGTFHDGDEEEVVPDGTNSPDSTNSPHFDPNNNIFYGGDNTDGFIGQVLTAEAINKTLFFINNLAYNGTELGMVDPATYNPLNDGIIYFPHGIAVTESPVAEGLPPQASDLQVTDASSDLFDQLSYLWGALNFKNMMDPNNSTDEAHWAYHEVFDGDPFPAPMSQTGMPGPFDLMMGTSKVIFINLMAMHFDNANGSFVNTSGLSGGVPTPGDEISTVNAGYITMVLAKMNEEFTNTPLEQMALDGVNNQASFILASLQDPAGGYYNGYTLNVGADNSAKTAVSQAAAARGLYAAYALTGNTDYLDGANAAYNYLIANFYDAGLMAFRTELGNDMATYTSFNFAVIAGGLREAALVGGHTEAAEIYTRFFKKVANAMQLSEFDPTGETGSDSDGDGVPFIQDQSEQLPPVFATEAQLDFTVTGIEDQQQFSNSDVNIFPNPATNEATIGLNIDKNTEVSIEAIDFSGRKIKTILNSQLQEGYYNITWNVSDLPSGIYHVRIMFGGSVIKAKKVVVL